MFRPFVILGNTTHPGETSHAVDLILQNNSSPVISLSNLDISYYDPHHHNQHDDFLPLIENMITHDTFIFATPVYWYTMSARMKTFIDRFSDLITIRKDLGRQLKGKRIFVIASYATGQPQGFESPFQQTCHYFQMDYKGCYYHYCGKDSHFVQQNVPNAALFSSKVFNDHI